MKKQLTREYLWNQMAEEYRLGYNAGYQQAKKDIALLVSHAEDNEDIKKIVAGLVPKENKEIEA